MIESLYNLYFWNAIITYILWKIMMLNSKSIDLMKNSILDIFEIIAITSELMVELVNKELLIIRRFQVDPKEIKCLLQWW
jgi:hypothetical protein